MAKIWSRYKKKDNFTESKMPFTDKSTIKIKILCATVAEKAALL
jgi:hypothetical protein